MLVSACPCLISRQHSVELEPVGLHIPLAVLCVLPELCFDKCFHTQPAQLGSLTRSSSWERLIPAELSLPGRS